MNIPTHLYIKSPPPAPKKITINKRTTFSLPGHSNSWNSHQLHSLTTTPQSRTLKSDTLTKRKKIQKEKNLPFFHLFTSLWPFAAAKWRGELRPPKVEYLARQGLQSNNILASTKSPSLAAETNLSPEAEHPNEFPILTTPLLSLSLPLRLSRTKKIRQRQFFWFVFFEALFMEVEIWWCGCLYI